MKKLLFISTLLISMAASASTITVNGVNDLNQAQATTLEVCSFVPSTLGLSENLVELNQGTVIGETTSVKATIGAKDKYKQGPTTVQVTIGDQAINGGIVGNTNPKDADGITPNTSLKEPYSGCFLRFDAKADGWIYLIIWANSHKAYTVFEEGMALGYTFAAIGDANSDLGAVYQYTLQGGGEFNWLSDAGITNVESAEREYLKAAKPSIYAARFTTNKNGEETWYNDDLKKMGVGVIKFQVYKDCVYTVNANGSKLIAAGFAFSKKDDLIIKNGDVTIYKPFKTDVAKEVVIDGFYYDLNLPKIGEAQLIQSKEGYSGGNVKIPETVTYEGQSYTVTSLDYCAFLGCENLTSVQIPLSVKKIGNHVFKGCNSLTSVVIPDGVVDIGLEAFKDCISLKKVVLGRKVTGIGSDAFGGCSLEDVTFLIDREKELYVWVDAFGEPGNQINATLHTYYSKITEEMPWCWFARKESIQKGDANADGVVNAADVVAVVNCILRKPNAVFVRWAADVDNNNKIDFDDIAAIIDIIIPKQQ